MLGKLMKYDLMAAIRKLGPLYLALLIMSVFIGLFIRLNVGENTVFTILIIVYGVTCIVCWVIPIIILALHFHRNLMEDEGYLMFALPVSTLEHIIAKVISALISATVCALTVILSFAIIALIGADINELMEMIDDIAKLLQYRIDVHTLLAILKFAGFTVLSSVQIISEIYAAIAIGHLFRNHETLGAVGAFIGMSVVFSFIINRFNLPDPFQVSILPYYLTSIVLIAVFTIITWFVLDRNLNLS